MSIFKRIYGRRIPATKMDAETGTGEEKETTPTNETPTAVVTTDETTKTAETTTATTNEAATTTTATETTETAAQASTTTGTAETQTTTEPSGATTTETGTSTTPPVVVANGGTSPRSFQFGAKAKMFRDMLAHHRLKFDSDQTQLLYIIGMLVLACLCSFGALGTNNWQCQGDLHVGLWNTCQEQSTFVAPPESANATAENSTSVTNAVMCTYHNSRNELDFIVADKTRIDQVQASQGLIICGTIMYAASLVALVFAYRFIKNKQTRNLNMMRNMLVAGIFTQILAFLLQLVGFFLYILTERLSTSVGLLFVYFGLALFATNVINFITIEYKAYKLRQQQIQQLN